MGYERRQPTRVSRREEEGEDARGGSTLTVVVLDNEAHRISDIDGKDKEGYNLAPMLQTLTGHCSSKHQYQHW